MSTKQRDSHLLGLTTDIVASYVSNNSIPRDQLGQFIEVVYNSLSDLGKSQEHSAQAVTPAISIKKSVTYDHIICLEDGKKFKSLKRHLKSVYNMSPAEYRAKWNLPSDYPMVAPSYSEKRSSLANKMGLGRNTAASKYKDSLH